MLPDPDNFWVWLHYEVDVTLNLVEKDDDGWYPQLRMHYYLTLGREFLTNRDTKRAKAQLELGENSVPPKY